MRRNNEFDKAESLYEQILNEDPSDPEVYWSLVLCRFGIEYVEDVKTKERKPTVNRTQMTSIFADENYKSAIKYADEEQKKLYRHEAEVINNIQKEIHLISEKEEPFDVFICYKESDEKNGKRSQDSMLAYDLYRELTRDGYKVFYARETLKGKLGTAYEPYIFSALNTAKVMVALGTKKEHFEAVWVRNEWSRFLGQIKSGEKKALIPVYRDMDAYDLPEDFANLQALDMNHVGYIQELIAGVENIVKVYRESDEPEIAPVVPASSPNEPKNKKKYPLIISIVAFVLAIAIGLTTFVVLNQKNPSLPEDNSSNEPTITDQESPMVGTLKNDLYNVQISSASNSLPADGTLSVDEIKDGTSYTLVADALPAGTKKFHAYDLSLISAGKLYALDGEITVTLPLPSDVEASKAAVYYVSDSGEATEHKSNVSGGNINFVTDHFSIYAIAEKNISDFPYTENSDGTLTITGYHGASHTIMIPENIEGKTVTAIGAKAFDSMDKLTSVTIPTSITSIGANAFYGCTSITSITIPESVDTMGVSVFYGWSSEQTVIVGGRSSNPTEWNNRWNATCDAKIVYSLKKLTFNSNSGEGSMADTYAEMNQNATLPSCTFSKLGYTFAGWATVADGTIVATDKGEFSMGNEDSYILYAIWTPNDNTLFFDANGGEGEMSSITIPSDHSASLSANAFTKEGYTFAGWSTDKSNHIAYANESKYIMGLNESYTLYAVWTANRNTVVFNANGGKGNMDTQTIQTDETKPLNSNTFTKDGYTFEGWSETKDGTVKYADGANYTMGAGASITLYAVWGANENKITLHANNGTNEKVIVNGDTDAAITLPRNTFTHAGYSFIGWSKTVGGEVIYKDGASYTVGTANANLYAVWKANDNTLHFDANGGNGEMIDLTIATDAIVTLPTGTFEKLGWTFAGWSTEKDGKVIYADGTQYTMGTATQYTLYAVWEIHTYKITYNLNNGKNHASNPNGFNIDTSTFELKAPTREGYAFKGWYTDAGFVTSMTEIEKGSHTDITLWAKWEAIGYTITLDANRGKETYDNLAVTYDTPYALPTPTRDGYTFEGWFNGDIEYTGGTWKTTASITLVARWKTKGYTIKYDLAGGSVSAGLVEDYHAESNSITLPTPTKTGHTFLGWIGTGLEETTQIVTISTGSLGDRFYTANWQVNIYTLTLDANGGAVSPDSQEVIYNAAYTLPTPTRDGYAFDGWYNNEIKYTDGTWQDTSDITLVAKWTTILYSIEYDLAGGAVDTELVKDYHAESNMVTLPTPTKTGYTFLGWTGTDLASAALTVIIPTGSIGHRVYTATWQVNTYTLSLNALGGTVSPTSKQVTYDAPYSLPTPAREGYTFDGWFNGEKQYTGGTWKDTSDVTLFAKWTTISYNIEYDLAGGTVDTELVKSYHTESNAITLPTPTKTGYTFLGWTGIGLESITQIVTIPTGSIGDRSYTANWKANTYTITLDVNGGVSSLESMNATYDSSYTLPVPSRIGYTFDGWYSDGTKYEDGIWKTALDIILTAEWAARTDIKYKVNHYQQNIEDDEYTLHTSMDLTGMADSIITPDTITYEGFTSPETQTVTIAPDGSLVVDYFYTRNIYTVEYITNGGDTLSSVTQKYQSPVTMPTPIREGYTFGGWFADVDLTIPCNGFIPATNAVYAWWIEESKAADFQYSVSTITGYQGSDTLMHIPEYIGGVRITSIADAAFAGCTSLTHVVVPDSILAIGSGAFTGCSNITDITLPFVGDRQKSIGAIPQYPLGYIFGSNSYDGAKAVKQLFHYSSATTLQLDSRTYYIPLSLKSVTITGGNILQGAFSNCSMLTNITLKDGVTSVEKGALMNCSKLENLTLPFVGAGKSSTPTHTERDCFGYIFAGSTSGRLTEQYYQKVGWCLYEVRIPSTLKTVTIIGGNIHQRTFYNCSSLTNINLGDGVTGIGQEAFAFCSSLTDIVIPDSVTVIKSHVFKSCKSLTQVTLSANLTTIPLGTFQSCSALETVIIPENVTKIDTAAFQYCSALVTVELSSQIESIGFATFASCLSLSQFNFHGTTAEWNAITKDSSWISSGCSYPVYCTDGMITAE